MLVKKFVWLINNDQSDTLKGGWVGGGSNRYGEKHNFVWSNWYESNSGIQLFKKCPCSSLCSLQSVTEEISRHNFNAKNITIVIVSRWVEDSPDKVKEAETSARMRGSMGERTSSLNRLQFASLWDRSCFQFLLRGLSLFFNHWSSIRLLNLDWGIFPHPFSLQTREVLSLQLFYSQCESL